jgi:hypothetical protein
LVTANEKAGLILSNYHTVTTLIAHLYRETQRSGLLSKAWPVMDQTIELHFDVLFNGKLPTSAREAYIRFQKLMGLSTTERPNRHQRGNPYKEPQCKRVPFSEATRPFLEREADFHTCLGHVESLIQAQRGLVHHESKHKRRSARRKLTPLELLIQIKEFLPSQMPKIQYDYISLTRTCYMIIKSIRMQIKRDLSVDHPLYPEEDSVQLYNPQMVLKIMKEARDVHNVTRSRQETLPQSPQMEVVARILKGYLDVREHVAAATSQ